MSMCRRLRRAMADWAVLSVIFSATDDDDLGAHIERAFKDEDF